MTLTPTAFEQLDTEDAEAVLRMRLRALVRIGFDPVNAMVLATHVDVDVERAADLLRRGCPQDTAVRILA